METRLSPETIPAFSAGEFFSTDEIITDKDDELIDNLIKEEKDTEEKGE